MTKKDSKAPIKESTKNDNIKNSKKDEVKKEEPNTNINESKIKPGLKKKESKIPEKKF